MIGFIFFKPPSNAKPAGATTKEKLLQMDFVGAALMMGLIVSFILALQYGGQTHPWDSSVVIGLLVGFVVITITFIAWEIYQKERAMIVPRLVSDLGHLPFPNSPLTIASTDHEAICLRGLDLHVLLRRCLLSDTLLP